MESAEAAKAAILDLANELSRGYTVEVNGVRNAQILKHHINALKDAIDSIEWIQTMLIPHEVYTPTARHPAEKTKEQS